jgi:hypothetical protein
MQVSAFWPTFFAFPDPSALIFFDATTGFSGRINGTKYTDPSGTRPYGSKTVVQPSKLLPIATALEWMRRFYRSTGAPPILLGNANIVPAGSSNDWHDDSRSSHTTGGARRRFVPIGLARHLRGLPDGLDSMKSFARDQEPRPVGHFLGTPFKYTGYYGICPDGWKYDDHDADGWSVFDPAHLECSAIWGGMIAGDQECAMHLVALGIALANTFPGGGAHGVPKGWRGSDQERAVGEVIGCYTRLALAGVGMGPACVEFRDRFLAGLDPKQHLIGLLKDLVARPTPFGAGNVDINCMPDIGSYLGRHECQGAFGWQNGIHDWWLAHALASGLVNDPLKSQVISWLRPRQDDWLARATSSGGISYSFSRAKDFTTDEVLAANKANHDPAHHTFELAAAIGGIGCIRDVPRVADSEVAAAGFALLGHLAEARAILDLHASPDRDPQDYARVATYLEPVYAVS